MIKVCVCGACGRMGSEVIRAISAEEDLILVGAVDIVNIGEVVGDICNTNDKILIEDDLKRAIIDADVVVDFTIPSAVFQNAKVAIENGVRPIIGATGLSEEEIKILEEDCNKNSIGCLIAANFTIGAVLMMEFAKKAAKYFKDVEIIEFHHDKKIDAPSGTSLTTAKLISEVRKEHHQGHPEESESLKGARGGDYEGMRVHSVRMKGYMASQEVLFGALGQVLSIRHDSFSRECYMPGVILGIREIIKKVKLIEGLDKIL